LAQTGGVGVAESMGSQPGEASVLAGGQDDLDDSGDRQYASLAMFTVRTTGSSSEVSAGTAGVSRRGRGRPTPRKLGCACLFAASRLSRGHRSIFLT
jgi:hypothetical protein